MAIKRVPIRGGLGKAIRTGGSTTVVTNPVTVVQRSTATAGVSPVAVAIWPLIQQIPIPVSDLAALAAPGLAVFDGTDLIVRSIAVGPSGLLSVSNPAGTAGNPTLDLEAAAANLALAGPTSGSAALPTFRALGLDTADFADQGTVHTVLHGNASGNPSWSAVDLASDVTGSLSAASVSGLATVATTGAYSDLTGLPSIPSTLEDLSDIQVTSVADGDVLTWVAADSKWENKPVSSGLTSPLTTKGDMWGWDTDNARIPVGSDGDVLTADSGATLGVSWQPAGGTGTVTSIDVQDNSTTPIFASSGGPVITSGTIDLTLDTQSANKIFGGPTTGSAAQPTFRSLVAADIPTIPASGVSGLATVATTGAYADLSGLPTLLTSPLTTKGDLWGFDTGDNRVPIGTDTYVLTADSTQPLGLKWAPAAGGASGANPTASVGLTAVDGTATTFLRSDGAPALDQAITPTWTGVHTFAAYPLLDNAVPLAAKDSVGSIRALLQLYSDNSTYLDTSPAGNIHIRTASAANIMSYSAAGGLGLTAASSGSTLYVNATVSAGAPAFVVNNPSTSGSVGDLNQFANFTNSADADVQLYVSCIGAVAKYALLTPSTATGMYLGTSNTRKFGVEYNGQILGYGPVATGMVDMTPDAGGFTGTLTGMAGTVTNTCIWSRNGNQVMLLLGAAVGTSNANTLTMTGLPSAIQPARTQFVSCPEGGLTTSAGGLAIQTAASVSGGTVTFWNGGSSTGWSSTGTKGVSNQFTISYMIN